MMTSRRLRMTLAALVLLGGLIHIQQFLAGFSSIPIVGPLFLVNGFASAVVAGLLVWRSEPLWIVGATMIGAGSLAAILISRGPGLFGYVSTTFEAPEALAVISEGAVVLLGALLLNRSRQRQALGV